MKDAGNKLIAALRNQGERITSVRLVLVEIFLNTPLPISAQEAQKLLKRKNQTVNKTTVYRELAFLKRKNIVKELAFGDGQARYELVSRQHHHHFICNNCKTVTDIDITEDLDKFIKKLGARGYQVSDHFMEFFGLCPKCLLR